MSEPITVSIRREVDPERITEATVWVQTGVNLAKFRADTERFGPGLERASRKLFDRWLDNVGL